MKDDMNIDELLSGFIDGELTQRQLTEVNRLIAHDPDIAKRLDGLKKCKSLLGSLPSAEAPADMLEDIKLALERRTLLSQSVHSRERLTGARHLLFRQVLSAAAMLALVAILGAVIYIIVAGTGNARHQFASEDLVKPTAKAKPVKSTGAEKTAPRPVVAAVAGGFTGRLELKTNAPVAVNAVIVRAIAENNFLENNSQTPDGVYVLNFSRGDLSLLIADLDNIWSKFDSAVLFIETGQPGSEVAVNSVTAEQVIEIAGQDTLPVQLSMAKDFATLNNVSANLPGKEVLAAVDNKKPQLITIPKPVLTSGGSTVLTAGEKTVKKSPARTEEKNVHLTIVVVGGG